MTEFMTRTVSVGGARIFVRESGSGPALVCLHAGVADHRMYDAQHAGLSESARVISFDRRGYGLTTTPDEPFAHVDDLEQVMKTCGVDTAVLLGSSQGGRIAIDFALGHPEKVSGLFLVAPVVSGMPEPKLPPDQRALDEAIDEAYAVEDLDRINVLELQAWLDGPSAEPGRVTGPTRDLFKDMNSRAIEHPELTRERKPAGAWDLVQSIQVPVRLCCGDLDFAFMQELGRTLSKRIPDADYCELPGMAHMPFLEIPDKMTGEIRRFLESRRQRTRPV